MPLQYAISFDHKLDIALDGLDSQVDESEVELVPSTGLSQEHHYWLHGDGGRLRKRSVSSFDVPVTKVTAWVYPWLIINTIGHYRTTV